METLLIATKRYIVPLQLVMVTFIEIFAAIKPAVGHSIVQGKSTTKTTNLSIKCFKKCLILSCNISQPIKKMCD